VADKFFPDIMVDIETTGLCPDRNAMIQLSAVRFDLANRDVGTDHFNRCLKIAPHRFWDEGTWEWWSEGAKYEVLKGIYTRMEDPRAVVEDFVQWVGPQARWWSKPSHFDFPFVASYCRDYGLHMPFDFRQANDMRSFMRGRTWPKQPVEPRLEFRGDAHNAVMDCIHQIATLFEFCDRLESKEDEQD
jgi:hypothetical protein